MTNKKAKATDSARAVQTRSYEQRHHVRHQLQKNIFVEIRGNIFDALSNVTDLSKGGLGFRSTCKARKLKGKRFLVDLVFDKNKAILRSLLSKVVFSHDTTPHKDETSGRYGLQFVNLSDLDKRLLDLISKRYVLSDHNIHVPKNISSDAEPN